LTSRCRAWARRPRTDWLDRSDEARGIEGAVANVVDQINPTGRLATRGYFNSLTWLLNLSGFLGVHTSGDGIITDPDGTVIATGAHKWVFNKRSGAAAQTAQVIGSYGNAGPWTKGQGFGVNQISLDAHGIMQADFDGLVLARTADPALTPVFDVSAILPLAAPTSPSHGSRPPPDHGVLAAVSRTRCSLLELLAGDAQRVLLRQARAVATRIAHA